MSEDKELRDWQAQIRVAMIKAADLYGTQVDNDAHEETMRILAEDDELIALRAENARLREELAMYTGRWENCQMAAKALLADCDRLRSWLRALEHDSPDSVRAALRGDEPAEGV